MRSAMHGRVVDPREAREGLDGVAQHVERHVRADGERRLLQPLAGLGPERVGAVSRSPSLSSVMNPLDSA
jgi:hypothetical protein